MSTLRELLNRARWRDGGLHAMEVHVLHRGAPGDRRVIAGSRITAARSAGIELSPETDEGDTIFVPYHRFLAIVGPGGAEIWSKEGGTAAAAAAVANASLQPAVDQPGSGTATEVADGTEVTSAFEVVLHEASWSTRPGLPKVAQAASPIVIDGSAGEGGGQILRTSLTLSMATGTPFVLERIRAGRKKPGLMRQHLSCVKAAALICGAEVEGVTLGSSRIVFRPGPVAPGAHLVDIGSAGSVSLVLQTLALPLALAHAQAPEAAPSRITVRGGTHALWAPPFPFLAQAWLPLVHRAGAAIDLELVSAGFHPAGGGEVAMTVRHAASASASGGAPVERTLLPLHLGETHALGKLELTAVVANLSEGIARRELAAAAERLGDVPLQLASQTVRSAGPGNAMWLVARDEGTGVCNVFSGIGDVGVAAEDVGRGVAEAFLAWRATGTSVEPHLADQVMLPIALAGGGSFTTSELTLHALTNIEVIRAFTGRRLRAWDLGSSRFRVVASPA